LPDADERDKVRQMLFLEGLYGYRRGTISHTT